jgi:hypothetical protein
MKLSVIIVSWNVKNDLVNCLRSIKENWPRQDFELIVVDNASTDGTIELLKSDFPEVKLIINEENRGFSAANNQGIKIAKGEYLFLLNPDTIVHCHSLDNLIKVLDENPTIGACGPKLLRSNGTTQISIGRYPTFRGILYRYTFFKSLRMFRAHYKRHCSYEPNKQLDIEFLSAAALMVRRSVIDQIGGWDERFFMYAEEADLCLRIRKAGWSMLYVPESVITHLHGRSAGHMSEAMRHFVFYQSLLIYFRKHRGVLQTRLFSFIFKPGVIISNVLDIFSFSVKYFVYILLSDRKKQSKSLSKLEKSLVFLGRYSWQFLFKA